MFALWRHSGMLLLFKLMLLLVLLASWLSVLSFFSFMCITLCYHDFLFRMSYAIATFSYNCMGFPLMLAILSFRLHFVFDGSVFKVHRYILCSFYISTAIISTCNLVYFVFFVNYYLFDRNIELFLIRLRFLFCGQILYLLLSCILVGTFIRKLNQLIIAQHSGTINNRKSIQNVRDIKLPANEMVLIQQVTKYLVVSCVAICTTFTAICGVFVMYIILIGTGPKHTGLQWTIVSFVGFVNGMCNTICLYLQFKFASKDYYRICGCCDHMCKRLLIIRLKKKIVIESISDEINVDIECGLFVEQEIKQNLKYVD